MSFIWSRLNLHIGSLNVDLYLDGIHYLALFTKETIFFFGGARVWTQGLFTIWATPPTLGPLYKKLGDPLAA
jgi:hypothetical protein